MNEITNRILTARLHEEIEDRKSFSISGDTMPLIIIGTMCQRNSLTVRVGDSYEELFNDMLNNGDLNYNYLDSLYGYVDDEENYSLVITDYKQAIYDGLERSDRFYYSENNFAEWDKQELETEQMIERLTAERWNTYEK